MPLIDDLLLEAMIDQTLTDSFPASDPPAWTLGRESQPNPCVELHQAIRNRDVRQETERSRHTVPSARQG
jgi:hypothetical protein